MENPKTFLTPEQVSELTGVRASTLANWRWAHRGPKFHRLGRSIRYEKGEVLRWAEAQAVEPETA